MFQLPLPLDQILNADQRGYLPHCHLSLQRLRPPHYRPGSRGLIGVINSPITETRRTFWPSMGMQHQEHQLPGCVETVACTVRPRYASLGKIQYSVFGAFLFPGRTDSLGHS